MATVILWMLLVRLVQVGALAWVMRIGAASRDHDVCDRVIIHNRLLALSWWALTRRLLPDSHCEVVIFRSKSGFRSAQPVTLVLVKHDDAVGATRSIRRLNQVLLTVDIISTSGFLLIEHHVVLAIGLHRRRRIWGKGGSLRGDWAAGRFPPAWMRSDKHV